MPLRLHRGADAKPQRHGEAVPLPQIEAAIKTSLAFIDQHLNEEAA
jgi:hypothetical protein